MPERLLITGVIALALVGFWVVLAWRASRFRRADATDLLSPSAGSARPLSLILAFSTPECLSCQTIQKPALEELTRRFPARVEVRHINATASPDLVKRFGIFTVPSTVLVGKDGRLLAINQSLAGWEKLAGQLQLNGERPRRRFLIRQG